MPLTLRSCWNTPQQSASNEAPSNRRGLYLLKSGAKRCITKGVQCPLSGCIPKQPERSRFLQQGCIAAVHTAKRVNTTDHPPALMHNLPRMI